jgi:beta-glucuronidase
MTGAARRFPGRSVVDLAGIWDFAFLGDADPSSVRPEALTFAERMAVPGCWDDTPKYAGRRGLAAYRTAVWVPREPGCYRLELDGAQHWCRAYVGSEPIGEHSWGFTRFGFDFRLPLSPEGSGAPEGALEITILVDNRFDAKRSPLHLEYFDWYQFGGIARGVWLMRLPEPHIRSLQVSTTDWRRRALRVSLCAASAAATPASVPLAPAGGEARARNRGALGGTVEPDPPGAERAGGPPR